MLKFVNEAFPRPILNVRLINIMNGRITLPGVIMSDQETSRLECGSFNSLTL